MTFIDYSRALLALLLLGFSLVDAHADGGVIRLRENQGPFVITILTAGDLIQDETADVSVMVQKRDSSEAVLDATVDLVFSPPTSTMPSAIQGEQLCGVAGSGLFFQATEPNRTQFTVRPSRKLASNKLLYAVPVRFGAVGNWRLEGFIQQGTEVAKVVCDVPVSPAAHGFIGLIPYVILPLLTVGLFVLNQYLRKRRPSSVF